jgi:hypothetical protein
MVLLAACEEESATVAGLGSEVSSSDLALALPAVISAHTVVRNVFDIEAAPGAGPARSEHLGYGTYPGYETEPAITEESGIFNAKTRANFLPGQLSVIGSHEFIGNKGSVDTKANLAFQGSIIGSNQSCVAGHRGCRRRGQADGRGGSGVRVVEIRRVRRGRAIARLAP